MATMYSTGLRDFIYGLNQYKRNPKSFYDLVLGTPQWIPKIVEGKYKLLKRLDKERQKVVAEDPGQECSYQTYLSHLQQIKNPLNYLEERLDRFRLVMRELKGDAAAKELPGDTSEKLAAFECHLFAEKMKISAQKSPENFREQLTRLYIGLNHCQTCNIPGDVQNPEDLYASGYFDLRGIINGVMEESARWENSPEPGIGLNDVADLFFKKERKMAALLIKLKNDRDHSHLASWKEEKCSEFNSNTAGEGLAIPFHLAIWYGHESALENQSLKDCILKLTPQDRLILGNEEVKEDLAKAVRQGIKDAYNIACFPRNFDEQFQGLCLARFSFPGSLLPASLEGKSISAAAFILAYIQFSGIGKGGDSADLQGFTERFAATGGSSEQIAVGGIPQKMRAVKPYLESGQIRYLFAPHDEATLPESEKILGLHSGWLKEFGDNDKVADYIRQAWDHFREPSLQNTPFLGLCAEPEFQDTKDVPFVGQNLDAFESGLVPQKANLIYGVGGIGKTRVLVEYFRNVRRDSRCRYPGGTLWLKGNSLKEDLVRAFQKAFFLSDDLPIDDLYEQVKEKFPELRHCLIVIDGFDPAEVDSEDASETSESVRDRMGQCLEDLLSGLDLSQTTVLISSKVALANDFPRLASKLAEKPFALLSEENALKLLHDYSKPQNPGPHELSRKLVREVDRHCLVLELFGRTLHTTGLSLEELMERWEAKALQMEEISKEAKRYRTLGTDHQAHVIRALNLMIDKDSPDNNEFIDFLLCLTLFFKQGISKDHWLEVSDLHKETFNARLEQARELGLVYFDRDKETFYTHGLTQLGLEQFWPEDPKEKRKTAEEYLEKSISFLEKKVSSKGVNSKEETQHLERGANRKGFPNLQIKFLCRLVDHHNEAFIDFDYGQELLQAADRLLKDVKKEDRAGLEVQVLNAWGEHLSARRKSGDLDRAIDYHQNALKNCRELIENHHPQMAKSLSNLGTAHLIRQQAGDLDEAIDCYERALKTAREVFDGNHPNMAEFFNNLAYGHASRQQTGDLDKAVGYYEHVLKILGNASKDNHPHFGKTVNNLGLALVARQRPGDVDKAIDCYEQALTIVRKVFGDNHSETARTLTNLALALGYRQQPGDLDQAIEYHQHTLKTFRESFGHNHPYIGNALANLAVALVARQQAGDLDKAIEYYQQVLKILRDSYQGDHPDIALTAYNLASAHGFRQQTGDLERAIDYFEYALKQFRTFYGDNYIYIGKTLTNLAVMLQYRQQTGDRDRAVNYLEQALEVYLDVFGDHHPETATCLNNLGSVLRSRQKEGDLDNAVDHFEHSLRIYRKVLESTHPDIASTLYNYASTLQTRNQKGDLKAAADNLELAVKIMTKVHGASHPETITMAEKLDQLKSGENS